MLCPPFAVHAGADTTSRGSSAVSFFPKVFAFHSFGRLPQGEVARLIAFDQEQIYPIWTGELHADHRRESLPVNCRYDQVSAADHSEEPLFRGHTGLMFAPLATKNKSQGKGRTHESAPSRRKRSCFALRAAAIPCAPRHACSLPRLLRHQRLILFTVQRSSSFSLARAGRRHHQPISSALRAPHIFTPSLRLAVCASIRAGTFSGQTFPEGHACALAPLPFASQRSRIAAHRIQQGCPDCVAGPGAIGRSLG